MSDDSLCFYKATPCATILDESDVTLSRCFNSLYRAWLYQRSNTENKSHKQQTYDDIMQVMMQLCHILTCQDLSKIDEWVMCKYFLMFTMCETLMRAYHEAGVASIDYTQRARSIIRAFMDHPIQDITTFNTLSTRVFQYQPFLLIHDFSVRVFASCYKKMRACALLSNACGYEHFICEFLHQRTLKTGMRKMTPQLSQQIYDKEVDAAMMYIASINFVSVFDTSTIPVVLIQSRDKRHQSNEFKTQFDASPSSSIPDTIS